MSNRGERRARSLRYSLRAQRTHLSVVHPDGALDCICERSVWYFRKRKSLGCDCRRRRHGAPKVPGGMCRLGDGHYRSAVEVRITGKRLARAWMSSIGAMDLLDVEL
jgi:hypothetical protein